MQKEVNTMHRQLRNMLVNSRAVIGLSWGLDQKRNGTEPTPIKPDGSWDRMAEDMMMNFSESGHPIFRASSAFDTGELRSKGGGKKSFHFTDNDEGIELLLCTVISANQLSVYGAIAGFMQRTSQRSQGSGETCGT